MRLNLFLIAAFCRLAELLSHSEQMGWLVGAVGIEPNALNPMTGVNNLYLPDQLQTSASVQKNQRLVSAEE